VIVTNKPKLKIQFSQNKTWSKTTCCSAIWYEYICGCQQFKPIT